MSSSWSVTASSTLNLVHMHVRCVLCITIETRNRTEQTNSEWIISSIHTWLTHIHTHTHTNASRSRRQFQMSPHTIHNQQQYASHIILYMYLLYVIMSPLFMFLFGTFVPMCIEIKWLVYFINCIKRLCTYFYLVNKRRVLLKLGELSATFSSVSPCLSMPVYMRRACGRSDWLGWLCGSAHPRPITPTTTTLPACEEKAFVRLEYIRILVIYLYNKWKFYKKIINII